MESPRPHYYKIDMEIELKKIKKMERLLLRLRNKSFNKDDKEEMRNLSSYFLYCAH